MLQSLNQNFPVKQAPLSHYDTSEAGDSNSIPWLQPFSEFHLLSRLIPFSGLFYAPLMD
jgi:hypothetical protein